jgi:hypothetical protein
MESPARIYFINNSFDEIPVPNGVKIKDITNNVAVLPHRNSFYLLWTDNYKISFNDEVIIDMTTQREWSLRGLQERTIKIVDTI